jgi:hypothetical protein
MQAIINDYCILLAAASIESMLYLISPLSFPSPSVITLYVYSWNYGSGFYSLATLPTNGGNKS